MSRLVCVLSLWWLAAVSAPARHAHHASADATTLKVGGLQFTIPGSWQVQTPETSARAGQWDVPSASDLPGDPVQVVVFFFGPGVGGTVPQNLDAWTAMMTAPDGTPHKASPQKRTAAGHAVTEILITGTYAQARPEPGLPPTPKPGYALWGAALENTGGTLYWRATGPAAQVAALAPTLNKVLDSLKPQPAAAAPP